MESTLQDVLLTDIVDHVGSPPSDRIRKSIRRMGIVQPVLLAETPNTDGTIRYTIIDGNRRISAARKCKLKSVPAVVIRNLSRDEIAQLTLAANGFCSSNYLTEFWALKQLERSEYTEEELQEISGFAQSSLAHRRGLSSLNHELFKGLRNGKLSQMYAAAIMKMPKQHQTALAHLYQENDRLRKQDIERYQPKRTPPIDTQGGVPSSPEGVAGTYPYGKQIFDIGTAELNHDAGDFTQKYSDGQSQTLTLSEHLEEAARLAILKELPKSVFLAMAESIWNSMLTRANTIGLGNEGE